MKEYPSMVEDPNDVVELTRNLIKIPSYVNLKDENGVPLEKNSPERVDERQIGQYIIDFLKKYTDLSVTKQEVADGRFNVIAGDLQNPKTIILGHMDTVRPSDGNMYDQFEAEIHDEKIWGLGACDMKSGIASILSAIAAIKSIKNVMFAFYTDEEYDFAGMYSLIKENQNISPEFILSADGGGGINNACRGLIELHGVLKGKSAHAGMPEAGKNAVYGVVDACRRMEEIFSKQVHPELGTSSINLGHILGGKSDSTNDDNTVVEQINAVPDIAKFKIDIRPSSLEITSDWVIQKIGNYFEKNGYTLESIKKHHDLGAWHTSREDMSEFVGDVERVTGKKAVFRDPK